MWSRDFSDTLTQKDFVVFFRILESSPALHPMPPGKQLPRSSWWSTLHHTMTLNWTWTRGRQTFPHPSSPTLAEVKCVPSSRGWVCQTSRPALPPSDGRHRTTSQESACTRSSTTAPRTTFSYTGMTLGIRVSKRIIWFGLNSGADQMKIVRLGQVEVN